MEESGKWQIFLKLFFYSLVSIKECMEEKLSKKVKFIFLIIHQVMQANLYGEMSLDLIYTRLEIFPYSRTVLVF
ncbi:hypothetical protein BTJ40_06695 [Microbulbifer sp. A4B17]|nr:hypothetical protein BTJ40_06695 [Microbulbifer sp. A4B17]